MPKKLVNVVIDTAEPARLAEFWAQVLDGWWVNALPDGEIDVVAPEADGATFDLVFAPVTDPKRGKNRLHLDLATGSAEHRAELVARALAAGASRADIGQGDVAWEVLADPEGNEFCVLEPREVYTDTGRVASIVVDAADPAALAGFWAAATGWDVVRDEPGFASLRAPDGRGPWLEFRPEAGPRMGKNRLHLDVADDDQQTHVDRLRALGAATADIGQDAVPWQVMVDIEGNVFCVLAPGHPG